MVAAEHTHEWRYHYVEWHHGFVLGKYIRCYSMVYIKTVLKREIGYLDVHSVAPRFNKMRFSKFANLVNALAIHNQQIVVRAFQIPPVARRALCYSMVYRYIHIYIYRTREKNGNRLSRLSLSCASFQTNAVLENCKFSKRARNT